MGKRDFDTVLVESVLHPSQDLPTHVPTFVGSHLDYRSQHDCRISQVIYAKHFGSFDHQRCPFFKHSQRTIDVGPIGNPDIGTLAATHRYGRRWER